MSFLILIMISRKQFYDHPVIRYIFLNTWHLKLWEMGQFVILYLSVCLSIYLSIYLFTSSILSEGIV